MTEQEMEGLVIEYVDDLMEDLYGEAADKTDKADKETREIIGAKLREIFGLEHLVSGNGELPPLQAARDEVVGKLEKLKQDAGTHYDNILRYFMLESLDRLWKEHLLNMDHLKEGIGLRGYGQKDPKQEYKREGFELFQDMLYRMKEAVLRDLTHLRLRRVEEEEFKHKDTVSDVQYQGGGSAPARAQPVKREKPKVGRNAPCPCGSGKKYKKCCGA